jgi:hypothetical protein
VTVAAIVPVVVLCSCGAGGGPAPSRATPTTEHGAPSRVTVAPTTPPTTASTTTTRPTVPGFLAQSASFVAADDGFLLGLVACPAGTCLALRHTVDGAETWTAVPAPPTTAADTVGGGVPGLHFADATNGWVFGTSLWATHDGAQTWHEVTMGGSVVAMASGAGVAYALVEPCASAPCTGPGELYSTPVGRDSWAEVAGVSGRFDTGTSALVAEGRSVFVMMASPSAEILGSTDGVHFAPLPVPCSPETTIPGPFEPADLAASDPSDMAVACIASGGAGSQPKQAYISHDGGHSYERLPDPPAGGDGAALAMPTPTTLLLAASSGATEVYRIAPPDLSWTTPLFLGGGGVPVSDPAFVDPAHGALVFGPATFAVSILGTSYAPSGLGTLYLTDDGGAVWQPVPVAP